MNCLYNAIVKWRTIGAFRLRPVVMGYTTSTTPAAGQILVQMNEKHPDGARLASTFGSGNALTIVYHRKSSDGTVWNFAPHRTDASHFDMQGIAMHELGHAFGLEHEDSIPTALMYPYDHPTERHGPVTKDIADIRALYGARDNDRAAIKRSINDGASWDAFPTNLTSIGVSTSIEPTAIRDYDQTVFFYTGPGKNPSWIRGNGDGSSYDTSKWFGFGGERSIYGTTGHGWNHDYIMAWVDNQSDLMQVKMVKSTDGGAAWSWIGDLPGATTIGTPAVHKLSDTTWVMAYAKLDAADHSKDGIIMTRVSNDGGWSWGPETAASTFYRALGGVSITSSGPSHVRIGFSWANDALGSNYLVRSLVMQVNGSALDYVGVIYSSDVTRTFPSMTKSASKLFEAIRGTNYAGVQYTRTSPFGSFAWDAAAPEIVSASLVTPSVAAYKDYAFAFSYYMQ